MIICDKVWIWCSLWCPLLWWINPPKLMKILDHTGVGIYNNCIPIMFILEDLSLVQRKLLLTFAVFQVPIAQNNKYIKAAYFRVACPKFLQLSPPQDFVFPAHCSTTEFASTQQVFKIYLLARWNQRAPTNGAMVMSGTSRLLDSSLQYNHDIAVITANLF